MEYFTVIWKEKKRKEKKRNISNIIILPPNYFKIFGVGLNRTSLILALIIVFFSSPCYKFASSSTAKQPYTAISTFSLNKSIFKHIAWGFFHAWVQLHYSHLFPCTRLFSSGALVCFPPLWLARIVTETGWHCLNSKPR